MSRVRVAAPILAAVTLAAACGGDSGTAPQSTLSGTVSSSLSSSMSGYVVRLDGAQTTTTNAAGSYAFSDVAPGTHTVSLDSASYAAGCLFAAAHSATVTKGAGATANFALDCLNLSGTYVGYARATAGGPISSYLASIGSFLVPVDSFPFTITATQLGRNGIRLTFSGSNITESTDSVTVIGPGVLLPTGAVTGAIVSPLATVTCTGKSDVSWTIADGGTALATLNGTLPLTCTFTIPGVGSSTETVTITAFVKKQ